MPQPTAVILVVGLSPSLIGDDCPTIKGLADRGSLISLRPPLPAVTCTAQSCMLTGVDPSQHGIVGNGWYNRELADVQFWKQSNKLVHAEKVWETARRRDPSVTCANICWWYNMYSTADYSVTPRPIYKADGRKIPDCYTEPYELRDILQRQFGTFPLFKFWGPATSIESTSWIVSAAIEVQRTYQPTLSLVYLPHLDYVLQRNGPHDEVEVAKHLREVDAEVARLVDHYTRVGVVPMIVSEYGISSVTRPIHINRILREAGLVRVREEQGLEVPDVGASDAFAVSDHQVAHVYVKDPARRDDVRALLAETEWIDEVLTGDAIKNRRLDHERSGDLVAIAATNAWFSYYHWLDDRLAPDYARTVDIHRKPGYDPVELFLDRRIQFPKLAIATRLLRKKLGFRTLMDVIGLDATRVQGSHGRDDLPRDLRPVLITPTKRDTSQELPMSGVRDVILSHLFDGVS